MGTLLADITVLDVTQVVAGSFASMMLGDLGADVIKIERPEAGDLGRSNPPFVAGRSAYFMSVNRNKRSVTLDLRTERGREAFLRLAETSDVVVENLTPGAMADFGLDYDAVAERVEDVVYCSISGFGQTGPYADLPALDLMAQAFSGTMSITGPPDGIPYRAGVPIGDIAASMYAVQSVLGALYRRERTGEGDHIDVAMVDGLLSWLTVRAGYSFATDRPYPRTGNRLEEFVPYGVYETADAYLAVAVVHDEHWRRLCRHLDRPDLAADGRFETVEGRREHRDALDEELTAAFAERPTAAWFEALAGSVPVSPVHDTLSVWDDEHVHARGLLEEREIDGTAHRFIAPPVHFESATTGIRRDPPALGEHTREQLRRVGYDAETLDELAADGVI